MHQEKYTEIYKTIIQPWVNNFTQQGKQVLNRIIPALDTNKISDLNDLSIFYHCLFMAKLASNTKNVELAKNTLALWDSYHKFKASHIYSFGRTSVILSDITNSFNPVGNATNLFLVTENNFKNIPQMNKKVFYTRAGKILEASGFYFFMNLGGGLILHTGRTKANEVMCAYTMPLLYFTVFTNYVDNAMRYIEVVVHETIHNYFFLLVNSLNHKWGESPMTFSPWLNRERPPEAIAHSVLTFSVVHRFYKNLIENHSSLLTPAELDYALMKTDYEHKRLLTVRDNFLKILSDVKNPFIREIMTDFVPDGYY